MLYLDFLNESDRARHLEAYDRASALLNDYLRFFMSATEAISGSADSAGHHITPMLLMLSFGEAIDGVAVLMKQGSARNCGHLLRSALEAKLGLFYIWETEADYERRCLAYLVAFYQQGLKWLERFDKDTPTGKELRTKLLGDPYAYIMDRGCPTDVSARRQLIQKELQSTLLDPVEREWQRMKAKKRTFRWYSLWGGPTDARELAFHLKMGATYEGAYRLWSEAAHSEDAIRRVKQSPVGQPLVEPIRSPGGLTGICIMACQFCMNLTRRAIDKFIPDEWPHYEAWAAENLEGRLPGIVDDSL
jgi:hypothetical protein